VKRYVRALARGMQYILDHPEETVQLVASFPEQVEKADKLAWRWKIQNPLFTSEDTKKNGLLWMNPAVWDEMMAFYKEYEQIPRVIPADEMMTNAFNPGIKR
jgi:NitT/TauT family transport system substrate-binding protein